MMDDQAIGVIVKYVVGNWPNAAINDETLEVYALELGDLDFDETISALREDFARADFPPPPMKLRDAVLGRRRSTVTYDQAMGELLNAITSVGYASPEPEWSTPALAALVAQRGGWVEVCKSTPARAAVDAAGIGAFNTWSAQFRDHYRVAAARYDAADNRLALQGPRPGELAP